MIELKDYFYNTKKYSDAEIKKFIYDFTDKFNPFLLISLNKQFVLDYLNKMDKANELGVLQKKNDGLEQLIGSEAYEKSSTILCRMYHYSDDAFKIEEFSEQFYNLNYLDHCEMTEKIQDFQFCMQEIILWLNSKSVSQYPKDQITERGNPKFNRNNWNENAFELFKYLDENYNKKGNVKFINIFKFLKEADKKIYAFNFTEREYREFIIKSKSITITKFSTAEFAYIDKELPILNSFEVLFRKGNLK